MAWDGHWAHTRDWQAYHHYHGRHKGDNIPFPTPFHGSAKRKCGFFLQQNGNRVNCRCIHNFVCLALFFSVCGFVLVGLKINYNKNNNIFSRQVLQFHNSELYFRTRPPNLCSHRRCERDFVFIPTHFYHATTLQLRAFAWHSASWPAGPLTIRLSDDLRYVTWTFFFSRGLSLILIYVMFCCVIFVSLNFIIFRVIQFVLMNLSRKRWHNGDEDGIRKRIV